MSVQAISAVLLMRGLSPSEKLLMLVMANYADPSFKCWPSQKTLAADTGLSDRTIRSLLVELERREIISREARTRENGSTTSSVILLNLQPVAPRKPFPPTVEKAETISAPPRKSTTEKAETISAPEPVIEPLERTARAREPFGGARRPLPKVDPEKKAAGDEVLRLMRMSAKPFPTKHAAAK